MTNQTEIIERFNSGQSMIRIEKETGMERHQISKFLKQNNIHRRKADQNSLSKLDLSKWDYIGDGWKPKISEPLFYLLGVLKGDGDVSITPRKTGAHYKVELTSTDRCFVESFISTLKAIGLSHSGWIFTEKMKNKNWNDAFKTRASCKIFLEWYKKTSLEWIQKNATEAQFKLAFIRGMYESEGSLLNNNGYYAIEIINTNEKLLSIIKKFLEELGFHPTMRKAKRKKIGGREHHKEVYKIGMYREKEVKDLIKNIKPCIPRKVAL